MSRWAPVATGLAVLATVVALAACESTQDKAKKVQAEGAAQLQSQVALDIGATSKDVKVVKSTLLHDQYGDAIVVELKNTSKETQRNLPILVALRDASGKSVFKNDAPGIDPGLNHVPLIQPGETFDWVNDQLQPTGTPKSAKVTVGVSTEKAPAELPEIEVSKAKVKSESSGIEAHGMVTNKSQLEQSNLVLFAVARQGGKVVAAGRGQVKTVKVDKPAPYHMFFIGDPQGAEVNVAAPPSTLQ